MRPYGLEYALIVGPDVADIQEQARKSSVGHFAGKSGDHHSYIRSSAAKRATRVAIKRGARTAARKAIARDLRDIG
jgi:hypothetical protein